MRPFPFNQKGGKFFSILLISLFSIGIVSCSKDKPDPQPDPAFHLNVTPATVQSTAASGAVTNVNIEANANWKLTIPPGIDWIEVNKATGTGNDVVQIKISKQNLNATARTAVLKVELLNGKASPKNITVQQDGTVQSNVNVDWKKVIGGNGNDYGYSIIKTQDGGYLLSGRTSSNNSGDVPATKGGIDMLVVKLDANGNITWNKTYGGNADEYSVAAAATTDGGYVLSGYTLTNNNGDVGANHGSTDFWVIKINATGTLQWQKVLGGTGDDRPNAVAVTTEGKIAVAGYTTSNNNGDVGANHGLEDMWVVLLDNTNGTLLSKKSIGGNGSEIAKAMAPAPDGGVFVGGTSTSSNNGDVGPGKGSLDFYILHLDKNLSIQWKNSLGGTNIEELHALATGPGNTLVAAGSTRSSNTGDVGNSNGGEDVWVVQLNALTGSMAWQKTIGGNVIDVAKGVAVKTDGSIVIAGYSYSHNSGDVGTSKGAGDFWVIKLGSTGSSSWKKLLGGDDEDLGFSIAQGNDGFVISGTTRSHNNGDVGANHGNSDVWVVKLRED